MVSVGYLDRTGKQGALIGILFCFNSCYNLYTNTRVSARKLDSVRYLIRTGITWGTWKGILFFVYNVLSRMIDEWFNHSY